MNIAEAFSIQLKKYRKLQNLTQESLALKSNLDRTYISLLERQKKKPTLNVVFKICNSLNVSTSDFIKEMEEYMKSPIFEMK
ncbi:hypothetical protein SH2C18_37780 [Clostridium sediminicola]|uniref:helix-turn-helix domain-containing protein n=1 Tax=Clostridium sediminicola TaxID=3114879 RepID=UPI0031F1C84F